MGDSIRNIPVVKGLLKPLSWLYGGITDLRNSFYDKGWLAVSDPPCTTISVGNLTVGGTGKTPMIEFLIRLLHERYKIAVVSRGYGRSTQGLVVADDASTAADIGDEPLQFYRKFSPEVKVIVAEKRAEAMQLIAREYPGTELILLDDAFQHRAVSRHLNILLADYNRLFFNDFPFPAGNLRERRSGAQRADLVVVTKCPAVLPAGEKQHITTGIHAYAAQRPPVFFASTRYGREVPFLENVSLEEYQKRAGLSGLAQNAPFEKFLTEAYGIGRFFSFPDHHHYSASDLENIIRHNDDKTAFLTTEKDMVKLLPLARALSVAERCFYIPIEVEMHEHTGFKSLITARTADS